MLTKERLLEVLEFDESVSRFRWKKREGRRTFNTRFAGKLAGRAGETHTPGRFYRQIRIDGVTYLEHRLVWMYHHGVWPEFALDHINGDGLDNRLENFRLDTDCANSRNQAKHIRNTSGHTNVYWRKERRKWLVRIYDNSHVIYGGSFDSIEEAALKAIELRAKLGFSPLHGLTREERKVSSEPAE